MTSATVSYQSIGVLRRDSQVLGLYRHSRDRCIVSAALGESHVIETISRSLGQLDKNDSLSNKPL